MVEPATLQHKHLSELSDTTVPSSKGKQKCKASDLFSEPETAEQRSLSPECHDTDNCVICLEPISDRCVASPCRHAYDYVCILNWLELRQTCPLCNASVEELLIVTGDGKTRRHHVEPPRSAAPGSTSQGPSSSSLSNTNNYSSRRHRYRPKSPPVAENTAILRRRFIYKHQLRSLYVGSNRMSRFRNVGPREFREDEELVSRARMWIRRELQVWEWTEGNREWLVEYIVGVLRSMELRGSAGMAVELLGEVLGGGENAGIFVHEMNAFLRSPFSSLQAFDAFVQYKIPIPKSFPPSSPLARREAAEGEGREGERE